MTGNYLTTGSSLCQTAKNRSVMDNVHSTHSNLAAMICPKCCVSASPSLRLQTWFGTSKYTAGTFPLNVSMQQGVTTDDLAVGVRTKKGSAELFTGNCLWHKNFLHARAVNGSESRYWTTSLQPCSRMQ